MDDGLTSTDVNKNSKLVNQMLGTKPIVLIGLMGAGKSTVGRRIAQYLNRPFVDSDNEIEKAAGMPIPDIFETHGEEEFRAGEVRVISRLLSENKNTVIATGGGAFMNEETRANIKKYAVSLWLDADIHLLFERVSRRNTRPLLRTANPFGTLKALYDERNPTYALADVKVTSFDGTHEAVAAKAIDALATHLTA